MASWAKEQTEWTKLKLDLEEIVLPFAKSKGIAEQKGQQVKSPDRRRDFWISGNLLGKLLGDENVRLP